MAIGQAIKWADVNLVGHVFGNVGYGARVAVGGIWVGLWADGVWVGAGVWVASVWGGAVGVGDEASVGDEVGVWVWVEVDESVGDGVFDGVLDGTDVRVGSGATVRVGMLTSVGSTAPSVALGSSAAVAVLAGRVGVGSFPAGWVMNKSPKPIR